MTILTPGPTEMSVDVLKEMIRSVNPDLDRDFFKIYDETAEMIKRIINWEGDVYIMSGEGMLGLEAAIANTVREGDRFVYVETPSGLINDINAVSEKVTGRGPLLIVDAVSAVGALPIDCKALGVDMCLMASQKAFSSPPGLAIVAVSKKAKEVIEKRKYMGYYMSINVWDEYLSQGMFPYTPAANDILALNRALKEIMNEGLESVYRRHEASREATIEGIKNLGLKLFVKEEKFSAPSVTALYSPLSPERILEFTWKKMGVMLAGSWGPLKDKVIRIGHMGYTAQRKFVTEGIAALGAALNFNGMHADTAEAVRRVNEVFDVYNL